MEKTVLIKLKANAKQNKLPHLAEIEKLLVEVINDRGGIARVTDLSAYLTDRNNKIDQSQISFLALLSNNLVVIDENDDYYMAVGIKALHDEAKVKELIAVIIKAVKSIGEQAPIEKIAKEVGSDLGPQQVRALASVSKQLAVLNGQWGLVKWPTVNPKNIRDKIYVILKENGKPLHFNEIAAAIKKSDFKRKDVTTQAIHNELIKDKRFILIGRGIYALKEWGYEKGTVADIITSVLRSAEKPLHRDEIIKQVLKSRFVKETTILLNLQGKSQFKRVAKATYALDESTVN